MIQFNLTDPTLNQNQFSDINDQNKLINNDQAMRVIKLMIPFNLIDPTLNSNQFNAFNSTKKNRIRPSIQRNFNAIQSMDQ